MRKKIALLMLGISISITGITTVSAAEFTSGIESSDLQEGADVFSDGIENGDISAMANDLAEQAEAKAQEAQEYLEEREAAIKAAEAKEVQKRAEAARKKAEELRKAAEEAKRKAEEEKRKAEEEAKRKAEEERLAKRQEIVDFALQFEGNPYVYGGTSLTNGADCSGFVMSVFKEFGYELPRVAAAQCEASVKKELSEIEPGDLVFYGDYGIDHVALYIGDGKIIHASTSATGIKISDFAYRTPAAVGSYLK